MHKLFIFVCLLAAFVNAQTEFYLPPNDSDAWQHLVPESLNWQVDEIPPMLDFLQQKHTKAFLVLYRG